MDFFEFFERFGRSARTKNIRQADGVGSGGGSWGFEKPNFQLPPASDLPLEFIRLCPWEMELLFLLARRARVGILEIGRYNGGSTFLLACAAPKVTVYSIDIAPKDDERLKGLLATHGVGGHVKLFIANSHIKNDQVNEIDLLFIDGDHTYDGCMGDVKAWYDNVVAGGMLVFHDSYNARTPYGVQDAVLDLLDEKGDELDVIVSPFIGAAYWRHPHGSMACLQKRRRASFI